MTDTPRSRPQTQPLTAQHAAALLSFELRHKDFFDSLIAMRPAGFYSPEGVQRHIEELSVLYAEGAAFPGVILDGQAIVGRANLRHVDREAQSAFVGYRVAQDRQGEGIASQALHDLIQRARGEFGLTTLKADVLDNNPASAHILSKRGFVRTGHTAQFLRLQCQCLGCSHFELAL